MTIVYELIKATPLICFGISYLCFINFVQSRFNALEKKIDLILDIAVAQGKLQRYTYGELLVFMGKEDNKNDNKL